MTSDREAARRAFLEQAGFGAAARTPLTGDASTRVYERLETGRGSLIFMDQPPALETPVCPPHADVQARIRLGYNASARLAGGRIEAFVACAGWLKDQGLSAPEIIAADAGAGFAVIEDLGDRLFAREFTAGRAEEPLYAAAVDLLVGLHARPPPAELAGGGFSWPLLDYDGLALKTGADLFLDWWPALVGAAPFAADARADWDQVWSDVRERGAAGASVFTHRDYHAENLLWLGGRSGTARVGLLDFQDALRGHPAWDLLSLLQDARRDVSPALEEGMLERYLSARPHVASAPFLAEYRGLAALNAARILGIFARQVKHFGRPRYAALVPRVRAALERNLADPALSDVRSWFRRHAAAERTA